MKRGRTIISVFRLNSLTTVATLSELPKAVGYSQDKAVLEFHNYDYQATDHGICRHSF
jgi:hypothetical protein